MRRARSFLGPGGMGGLVSLWGAPSLIQSIQRGSITIPAAAASNTATITAVDTARTRIVFLGTVMGADAGGADNLACRVALTNATTVTASSNSSASVDRIVYYEVIEYMPGVVRSVQRGTLATTASGSGSATINAVNTAKTMIDNLGFTSTSATETFSESGFRLSLTNSTTIDGSGQGSITRTVGYQATEFY